MSGPILTEWGVRGWPTICLIDAQGNLRKWVGNPARRRWTRRSTRSSPSEERREGRREEVASRSEHGLAGAAHGAAPRFRREG
jgi:hypothetical protein